MTDKEFLEHIGIPGMKWGHRKISQLTNKNPTSKQVTIPSEDHIKKIILKNKKIREMTNAELRTFNERLQLEKQYKDLTKTEITPGKKFISDLLLNTAKQTVSVYAAKYMSKGMDTLIKKTSK